MSDVKVEYNFLGRSGVKVSNICLGGWTFGKSNWAWSPRLAEDEEAYRILDAFASYGGNYIDTANVYNLGRSEEVIGQWLAKNDRQKFIVSTKVGYPVDENDINQAGLSRRHITDNIERSLERLQTHYIDLYMTHYWDAFTPLDETLRTFDDLVRCGKIRYFGPTNICGWQLQKMVDRLDAMGLNSCVSLQQQYNLMFREPELDEFVVCKNEGIAVLPFSPLKGGLLTGKYQRHKEPDSKTSRMGFFNSKNMKFEGANPLVKYANDDDYWNLLDVLREISEEVGKSMSEVALRWMLQKEFVTSVAIGVTSLEQLEENMGAATGWELSEEEMAKLDVLTAPRIRNPFDQMDLVNGPRGTNPIPGQHFKL